MAPADRSGAGGPRPHARRRPLPRPLLTAERHREAYFLLFGLLLLNIFFLAIAKSGRWQTFVSVVLVAATLMLALQTSEARKATQRVAAIAAALAVLMALSVALTDSTGLTGYMYIVLVALLVLSPLAVGRKILTSRRVTLNTLVAALCVYLMIGLLFTFVYLAMDALHPDFFAQGQQTDPSIYLYFSYITMTTVGFGDFTPASNVPRAAVVFEAIIGQIFLVTAVARLVSLYSASEPSPGPSPDDGENEGNVPSDEAPGIDGGD